MFSRINTILEC